MVWPIATVRSRTITTASTSGATIIWGQYAGVQGVVDTAVVQCTVDYPEEYSPGYHVGSKSGWRSGVSLVGNEGVGQESLKGLLHSIQGDVPSHFMREDMR